jgi:hypothetical protein
VIGTEGFDVDATRSIAEHQTTITEIAEQRWVPPPPVRRIRGLSALV